MKNPKNKKRQNNIFILLSCTIVACVCFFSCKGNCVEESVSDTVTSECPKTEFAIITNKDGNGKYVALDKKRGFSVSCGDTILKFSADKGELFQVKGEKCTTHKRPILICGSSEYHPLEVVNKNDLPQQQVDSNIKAIEPIEFFANNDSIKVRFHCEETINVKIFYGLTDTLLGECKADSNLYTFHINTSKSSIEKHIDTFRVAGERRLSYLVTMTRNKTVSTASTSDSADATITPESNKFNWLLIICFSIIIAIVLCIVLLIVRHIRGKDNSPKFDHKPHEEILSKDNPLSKVNFVCFTIKNKGKNNKGKKEKRFLYGVCKNINADSAQVIIDILLKDYYDKSDENLEQYLTNQKPSLGTYDLKVPYRIDKSTNVKNDKEWHKYKKSGLSYKVFSDNLFKNITDDATSEPGNDTLPDENIKTLGDDNANNNAQNAILQTEQNDTIAVSDEKIVQQEESADEQQTVPDLHSGENEPQPADTQSPTAPTNEDYETQLNALRQELKTEKQKYLNLSESLRLEKENSTRLQTKLDDLNNKFDNKVKEKVAGVQTKLKQKKTELLETSDKLSALEKEFNSLKEKDQELQNKYNTLNNEKKDVDNKLKDIERKQSNEIEELRNEHKKTINIMIEDNKNALTQQKNQYEETISVYSSYFKIYKGCGSYTSNACDFLNSLDQLLQEQVKLSDKISNKKINDTEKDTFNYYFASVTNKYHKAISGLKLDEYRKELADLNETTMTRTGREVDKILKTSSPSKYVDDLRYRAYDGLFKKLCGASIVLSDDLASLNQLCPSAVSKSDIAVFSDITKSLLKSTRDMGYNPVYVKLFTPYSDYSDISVEKTIELEGTNKKDVVEILEMAVNYGTQKSKTKVSANV